MTRHHCNDCGEPIPNGTAYIRSRCFRQVALCSACVVGESVIPAQRAEPAVTGPVPVMLSEAARLVELNRAACRVDHENAERATTGHLTGAHVEESLRAHDALDAACEAFRRRYFPRSARVIAALGLVCVTSPAGRRSRIVYDAERAAALAG